MASTYFDGGSSEIQSSAEGLQTLYLMNPTYVPFSDTTSHHSATNMLLLHPPADALNLPTLSHAPPHNHHLLALTIPTNNVGSTSTRPTLLGQHHDNIPSLHAFAATPPRLPPNLWPSVIDHQSPSSPAATYRRPTEQGLSLTLSPQQQTANYNRSLSGEFDVPGQPPTSHGSGSGSDDMQIPGNCLSNLSVILGSKYLKAAQELLDEVVNVGKGIEKGDQCLEMEGTNIKHKMKATTSESESGNIIDDASCGAASKQPPPPPPDLTTAQRQELQMKKSKLVNMLDEVEQRYRQYRHQMHIVISSFEQAAGYGAAKSYTSLALKTISKQFRCLKDAISSQIKATSKGLGEEDCLGAKVEGSRLRYVDHHLRQQRALQQLGMMQHNAWRPQRGLPERAVSILRAWLFEHFLHPYPKDSDKVMLAKQTGLTRSQVSNWFINARVRLWKPMVEEMYLEETKEQQDQQEQNSNGASNSKSKGNTTNRSSKDESSKVDAKNNNNNNYNNNNIAAVPISPAAGASNIIRSFDDQIKALQSKSNHAFNINQASNSLPHVISSSNSAMGMGSGVSHNVSADVEMKPRNNIIKDGYNYNPSNISGGGGSYAGIGFSMQDIGRFSVNNVSEQQLAPRFHGNGVSLTLGLPHTDNLPLSATRHGFLSHLGTNNGSSEFCGITTPPPTSSHNSGSTNYGTLDIQNRKSFAAQLLPDFVT